MANQIPPTDPMEPGIKPFGTGSAGADPGPGVDPPGTALPKAKPGETDPPQVDPPGSALPKTEPVTKPPHTVKPVQFATAEPPNETLPVDPPGGSLDGASGSGGRRYIGARRYVGKRRGLSSYSSPIHPSSRRSY